MINEGNRRRSNFQVSKGKIQAMQFWVLNFEVPSCSRQAFCRSKAGIPNWNPIHCIQCTVCTVYKRYVTIGLNLRLSNSESESIIWIYLNQLSQQNCWNGSMNSDEFRWLIEHGSDVWNFQIRKLMSGKKEKPAKKSFILIQIVRHDNRPNSRCILHTSTDLLFWAGNRKEAN